MSLKISAVKGYEILDSRGNPTVMATVTLNDGSVGQGFVPSGASTGASEAVELRDGNLDRYLGKGVTKAIRHLEKDIAPIIKGRDPFDQEQLDADMIEADATVNKSEFGANAMLAASLAIADAAAKSAHIPMYEYLGGHDISLPVPMLNIINGGAHANNNIDIQEFMIVPAGFASFSEAFRASVEIYHHLKAMLSEKGHMTSVGDEGGFAPNLKNHTEALNYIMKALEKAGYRPGEQVWIALDVAASEIYKEGHYHLASAKSPMDSDGLIAMYEKIIKKFPVISIEDGLAENDWDGWRVLQEALGKKIQLVGDDIFVTNMGLLNRAIKEKSANAILIKPNQIGTLTETLSCIGVAKRHGWNAVISHRSGETESSFIADLAVGTMAGQIKSGAPCRSDRVAKYNQLLLIEQQLGKKAPFVGKKVFDQWLTS